MKETHQWVEQVDARCPYCGKWFIYECVGDEGDLIDCLYCHKQFKLGEQK